MTTTHILNPQNRDSVFAPSQNPRIGIMAPLDDQGTVKLCSRWSKPFLDAGIDVVLIPVGAPGVQNIARHLNGLLMPGGHSNIHPSFYSHHVNVDEGELRDVERDEYAMKLLKAAYEADIPTLGICRGMQEMVVAFGGHLEKLDTALINHAKGYDYDGDHEKMDTLIHDMTVLPSGVLASIFGEITKQVNSIHAYGLTQQSWRLNDIFRIEALAPDKVVEAVSARGKSFFVGVQAHFEFTGPWHDGLFGRFFDHIRNTHEQKTTHPERVLEGV